MKNSAVVLIFVCFGSLFLLCYAPALFQGRQFGFRDAGHFYYPLHQRVQKEWNQGRWPLWEPEENAGMPLLGNPTAAVLYPGKLVFAVLPYAWGARIYIVMHTALAFVAMLVLLRSWGTSWSGSGLGALGYTFGAPILFQYCNVIYLVGAAWLPLGMHAVDRWVRLGRRWGLWELAAVLAMQVLGGDPQAAYLLGLSGAGYALGLAWSRARARTARQIAEGNGPRSRRARSVLPALGLIAAVLLWSAATVAMGVLLPKLREPDSGPPTPPLRWMPWMPIGGRRGLGCGRPWLPLFLLLAPAGLATPAGGHVAGPGDGGRGGGEPDGGAAPSGHRVHPTDDEGRGGRSSRHLCLQRRAVPAGRADLAQFRGPSVWREQLLARRDPDTGCLSQDLGTVALPGRDDRHSGIGRPGGAAGTTVAGVAVGDRGGQLARRPGAVHQPDLGGADGRRHGAFARARAPGRGARSGRRSRRFADPAGRLSQGRRRQHLLVAGDVSAGLPAVSVPGKALHPHVAGSGRPGRDRVGPVLRRPCEGERLSRSVFSSSSACASLRGS